MPPKKFLNPMYRTVILPATGMTRNLSKTRRECRQIKVMGQLSKADRAQTSRLVRPNMGRAQPIGSFSLMVAAAGQCPAPVSPKAGQRPTAARKPVCPQNLAARVEVWPDALARSLLGVGSQSINTMVDVAFSGPSPPG